MKSEMILGIENVDNEINNAEQYYVLDTASLRLYKATGESILQSSENFLNVVDGNVTRQCVRFEDFIKLGVGTNPAEGVLSHLSRNGVLTKLVFNEPYVLEEVTIKGQNFVHTESIKATDTKNKYGLYINDKPVLDLQTKNGLVLENPVYELIGVWLVGNKLTCLTRFGDNRGIISGGYMENIKVTIDRYSGKFIEAKIDKFNSTHNLDISKFDLILK